MSSVERRATEYATRKTRHAQPAARLTRFIFKAVSTSDCALPTLKIGGGGR